MKKRLIFLAFLIIIQCFVISVAASEDCYVYDASKLYQNVTTMGGISLSDPMLEADGRYYASFGVATEGNAGDNTMINIHSGNFAQGFTVKEYPIIKIGYRSSIAASGAVIDANIWLEYSDSKTRLWGWNINYNKNNSASEIYIDMTDATGGQIDGDFDYSKINDGSPYNTLTLKPFAYGKPMQLSDRFDIEYVGFFKDEETARSYKHSSSISFTPESIKLNIRAARRFVGESLELCATSEPSYSLLGKLSYTSEDPEIASVDSSGKVTALSVGDTYITAVDENGNSDRCHIYVFDSALPAVEIIPRNVRTNRRDVVINCFGDSITAMAPAPERNMNYHAWFAEWYHIFNNNYGICGSTLSTANGGSNPFVLRYKNMSDDADIIFVKGGVNDFAITPIGGSIERHDNTYRGAVRTLMEGLIEKYPDKHIVFLTVLHHSSSNHTADTKNVSGSTLGDFAAAVMELAEEYGIDAIDIYNPPQFDFTKAEVQPDLLPDLLHPSGEGHKILAEYLMNKLIEMNIITVNNTLEDEEVTIGEYKTFTAAELLSAISPKTGGLKVDQTLVSDGSRNYVRITAGGNTVSRDSTQVIFELSRLGNNFKLKEFPFVRIGYRNNITAAAGSEILAKQNNAYKRHWGMEPVFKPDGKRHYLIMNMASAITGNEGGSYSSFDDIDDDSLINEFWFKPWGGQSNAAMNEDDYLDIEYIAFFKSSTDASNYELTSSDEPAKLDKKIFYAETLLEGASATFCGLESSTVSDGRRNYVRITSNGAVESNDNTMVNFKLADDDNDFLIKDYPYIVVSYRSNFNTNWDVNPVLKNNGTYKRHWPVRHQMLGDGSIEYALLDIAADINGCEGGDTTFADVDDDSTLTNLVLKPWGGQSKSEMKESDTLDIEFIAVFRKAIDANSYIERLKDSKTDGGESGDANGDGAVDTLDALCMLRAASGITGYDPAEFDTNCDFDGDGKFTAKDAIIFARHLAGWRGYETLSSISEDSSADHDVYSRENKD